MEWTLSNVALLLATLLVPLLLAVAIIGGNAAAIGPRIAYARLVAGPRGLLCDPRASKRDDSMALDSARIAEWLQPQHILLDIDATDAVQVLEIAAATTAQARQLDPAPIFSALWRREQARSTGLGDGFAIPHARIGDIATPITLFMRTKVGIAFHAPDGKPVSQLLVIMVPADGAKQDHLDLLALVAQLFSSHEFRKRLTSAADTKAAADVFRVGVAEIT